MTEYDSCKQSGHPRIHLWAPDLLDGNGGIRAFSKVFLEALKASCPGPVVKALVKNDAHRADASSELADTSFYGAGDWPLYCRTPAFAAQLGWQSWRARPDLIISTHVNFTPVASWLKKQYGIPYWIIAHGIEVWNIKKAGLVQALRQADLVLAVSNYTRNCLLEDSALTARQVAWLPNTFDEQKFSVSPKPKHLLERYGLSAATPVILTVARLASGERYKGYDKIIQALPQIRQILPDVHYLLVGQGKDQQRVANLATDLKVRDCVTLAGFVPDEELNDHYNLCDLFAMPSVKEGFGIVYLEALAAGKPVLAGNLDGSVDALCQGELGALVNPYNLEEIITTIISILRREYPNPLLYEPAALRRKVIEVYGFDQFKRRLDHHLRTFWDKQRDV